MGGIIINGCEYCKKGKPLFRIVESYPFGNRGDDCCDICCTEHCKGEDDDCVQYVSQRTYYAKENCINLYIGIVDQSTMFYNGSPAIMYEDKSKGPENNKIYLPINLCPVCGDKLHKGETNE